MPDLIPPPAVPVAPVGVPPAAPAAPVTPPARIVAARPQVAPGEEPWKGERAKREARQYLKQFGIKVGKKDDVASLAAEYVEKQGKRKSELSDLRKKVPELEARVNSANTVLKMHADQALAKLPEAAQAAIKTLAGEDPIKILEQVALTATLAAATAPAPPAAPVAPAGAGAAPPAKVPPVKVPVPPGANTTAAGGAPPPASPNSPTNHREVWERLSETNPMMAAQYARRHNREIFDTPT